CCSLAYSRDGNALAVGRFNGGSVELLDAKSCKLLVRLPDQLASVRWLAWSPDGQMLATAGSREKARIWDAKDGRLLVVLAGLRNGDGIALSPEGHYRA